MNLCSIFPLYFVESYYMFMPMKKRFAFAVPLAFVFMPTMLGQPAFTAHHYERGSPEHLEVLRQMCDASDGRSDGLPGKPINENCCRVKHYPGCK